MEQIIMNTLLWLVSVAGGLKAIENFLENYIMQRLPERYRGMVPPVLGAVFAIIGYMQGGMTFGAAVATFLTTWGGLTYIHDNPTLTAADWALPAPPDDALGVSK